MNQHPKPDLQTMQRVEDFLRQELEELGVDITELLPHEITENMHCSVYPDGTLSYSWKERPLLNVEPEEKADGEIRWRLYTRSEPVQ